MPAVLDPLIIAALTMQVAVAVQAELEQMEAPLLAPVVQAVQALHPAFRVLVLPTPVAAVAEVQEHKDLVDPVVAEMQQCRDQPELLIPVVAVAAKAIRDPVLAG